MIWVGYEKWPVKRLSLPGDIAQRMKAPHVIALAASTDELGGEPMHAPSVNADVNPPELVAGRDRMAATLLRKRKHVWVHVGKDWTAADLFRAEIHENLHRRHDDKAALTKRLVDKAEAFVSAWAAEHAAEVSGQTSDNAPAQGRPKTNRTKARELVAKESGKTPEAVRKQDERAQARDEGAAGNRNAGASTVPPPPPIEVNGHEMPAIVAGSIGPITAAFDKADKLLRQAQAALDDLTLSTFSPGVAHRLKQMIHDDAAAVRAERPYALCPYCIGKLEPDQLQGDGGPKCGVCQEQRYVNRAQFEAAPRKKLHGAEAIRAARAEDCAHAYRKGAVPTGICLSCGAEGAPTWAEAALTKTGDGPPPHEPNDAGWVAHGPGSDRKPAETKKPRKALKVELNGETMSLEELERRTNGTP